MGGSGQLSMEGKSHVGRNNLESFWKLSWAARMGRIRYMVGIKASEHCSPLTQAAHFQGELPGGGL